MLHQAERSGKLSIENKESTVGYKKMVEQIKYIIYKDTPTEFVLREVNMLAEILS